MTLLQNLGILPTTGRSTLSEEQDQQQVRSSSCSKTENLRRRLLPFPNRFKDRTLSGAAGAVGAPLPRSRSSIWRRTWWPWWPSWRLAADNEGLDHFEDDMSIFLDSLHGVLGYDEDVLHMSHRWLSWI